MSRFCQLVLIGLVLALVVAGLNTSNEAINQLTGSERPAMVAVQAGTSQLDIQWAGEEYVIELDKLMASGSVSFREAAHSAVHYLQKIWLIFRTVFLS